MLQIILFRHYNLQQWLALPLAIATNTGQFGEGGKCPWKMILELRNTGKVQRHTLKKNATG